MRRTRERMRREWTLWAVGVVVGLLASMALVAPVLAEQAEVLSRPVVDHGVGSYAPVANLSGNLVIAGSDTMQPLMLKLAAAFRQLYPAAKIGILGGGTERALMQFVSDQAQIRRGDGFYNGPQASGRVSMLASSRRLTEEESKDFHARFGYDPTEITIAMDAVAIYVNRENPIQGLTLEQVDAIFGKDRKRGAGEDITTWGQAGVESWAQQPIRLHGRDKQSGTRSFFKQEALAGGELKAEVKEAPGSASEILAIAKDPQAIGYAGIGFQTSFVRAVPLAEKAGQPFVAPSAAAAADGTYPLHRPLYLYVNMDPKVALDREEMEFLKFINSREGQQIVVKAGVYPLSSAHVAKNLQVLTGSPMAAAATGVSAVN